MRAVWFVCTPVNIGFGFRCLDLIIFGMVCPCSSVYSLGPVVLWGMLSCYAGYILHCDWKGKRDCGLRIQMRSSKSEFNFGFIWYCREFFCTPGLAPLLSLCDDIDWSVIMVASLLVFVRYFVYYYSRKS